MEALRWILLLAGAVLLGVIYWRGRQQERSAGGDSLFERARRGLARDGADAGDRAEPRADPDLGLSDDDLRGFDFDPDTDMDAGTAPETRPGAEAAGTAGAGAPETGDQGTGDAAGAVGAGDAPAEPGPGGSPGAGAPDETAPGPAADGPVHRSTERVVVLYVVAPAGERLVGSRLLEALEGRGLRHGAYSIFHASDSEGSTVFSVANAVDPGTFDRSTMDTLSTPGVAFFLQVPGPQAAETAFDRMLHTARGVADDLEARVLDEQHSTLTRQTEQHLREELRLIDRRTVQR